MTYNYDPELAAVIDLLPEGLIDLTNPAASRAAFVEMIDAMNAEINTEGVVCKESATAGDVTVPIRIYTPAGLAEKAPALLHIHGGGFVIGNLDSEMGTCYALCRELGAVIVSVDYRLAPEFPYPAALDDCFGALSWMASEAEQLSIDTSRVGVFGISAGGGLAAATCLAAKERGGPAIAFAYLGIPELDDRLQTPSMQQFTDTPMWNRPNAELSWDAYLGSNWQRGGDDVPHLAAPARAQDVAGLPPTYVSTMEFDPLRDEGVLYALKLMQAGVSTELHSFPGTFHGSTLFTHAQISQREAAEMMSVLRRGLRIES